MQFFTFPVLFTHSDILTSMIVMQDWRATHVYINKGTKVKYVDTAITVKKYEMVGRIKLHHVQFTNK